MAHHIHPSCSGCTACARQCPTGAISGSAETLHVIDPHLCVDCGVCGWICPVPETITDAGGRAVARLPRELRPQPRIDPELCNGCGACVDVCPFGSLVVDGARYSGWARLARPETCVSCGLCESICIKRAVRCEPPAPRGEV